MAYNKAGDGRVIKKGKTDVKVFPTDGAHIVQNMKTGPGSKMGQKMKAVGRNMARVENQKSGGKYAK